MIKDVEIGIGNSFILLENGDLWGCGGNVYGELGLGHTKQMNTFVKIGEDVEKIKCYLDAIFLFKKDKTLWFAGNGFYFGKKENFTSFIKIEDNVKDILYFRSPKGENFLFCLKDNGELLDLIGHKVNLSDVEKVVGYQDVKEVIECPMSNIPYLFVVKKDGSLFYFRENVFNKVKPFNKVKNVFSCYKTPIFIQKTDDSLWKIENYKFEKGVKIFDDIKDVITFGNRAFFLKKNGHLFVLGENNYGQLGTEQKKVNTPTLVAKNVKEVHPLIFYTLILKKDNSLWGCGKDMHNIFRNKKYNYYLSFKKICDDVKKVYANEHPSLFIIKQNNELWCSGEIARFYQGNDRLKLISDNVKELFLNPGYFRDHFFILKEDNTLLCFGSNKYGQLGVDSKKSLIIKPTECSIIKNYYNTKKNHKSYKKSF